MSSSRVETYLARQKSLGGPFANDWLQFASLYQSRLWHELTLAVTAFVQRPELQSGEQLKDFYEQFLSDFEHRINPLALVEISVFIARTCPGVEFLRQIREKVKNHSLAVLLCDVTIGQTLLVDKNFDESKRIIDDLTNRIDQWDHLTAVHSRFYELAASYYRLMGNHSEYYQHALKYLGCIDPVRLPGREKAERAFNLGLAALLAEDVYNFGEILQHPILDALHETREQWLVDLLKAFHLGDLDQYERLKAIWQIQPDLGKAEVVLHRKIVLLCLMETIFSSGGTRTLTFDQVAKRTKLGKEQVELLAMHALSLGLIRGTIDQVEEIFQMHWVKPRVLDLGQVATLKKRLDHWTDDVKQMSVLLERQAGDILS